MSDAYKLNQALAVLLSVRQATLEQDIEIIDDATGEILNPEELETDAMALLDKTLRAAVEMDDLAEMAAARAKKVKERADRLAKRAEALRAGAFAAMDALEITKRELPDLTASISKGTQRVIVTDEAKAMAAYPRMTTTLDRDTLNKKLKAGEKFDFAELANGSPQLRIRTQ